MPSKAIRHALTKLEAACLDAALDEGPVEDVLDTPRMYLVRAAKAVDGFRLGPDPTGIELVGKLQAELAALLAQLDRCLPRMNVEKQHGAGSRAVLADIVTAVPGLSDDARGLDKYVSTLAMFD
jgi:hypothetical protein